MISRLQRSELFTLQSRVQRSWSRLLLHDLVDQVSFAGESGGMDAVQPEALAETAKKRDAIAKDKWDDVEVDFVD